MEEEHINIFTGNDEEKKPDDNWHMMLIGIVILVIIILLYFSGDNFIVSKLRHKKQHFALPQPQAITGIYTAGAGIRQQSVDSASNRGMNDLPYTTHAKY